MDITSITTTLHDIAVIVTTIAVGIGGLLSAIQVTKWGKNASTAKSLESAERIAYLLQYYADIAVKATEQEFTSDDASPETRHAAKRTMALTKLWGLLPDTITRTMSADDASKLVSIVEKAVREMNREKPSVLTAINS
jgi:hypothetical protein